MRVVVCLIVALLLLGCDLSAQMIPPRAQQFKRLLITSARPVWGIDAPTGILGSQVHAESAWRPDARSPFANGLAQFVPATAAWLSEKYPELGPARPFEPEYALAALARYDKFLYDRQQMAATDCHRWSMTLVSFNGGEGTLNKEKKLAADPTRWWGSVELKRARSQAAFVESRNYPRRILLLLQPVYIKALWGRGVDCSEVR